MGSGSSSKKVRKENRQIQVPSASKSRGRPPSSPVVVRPYNDYRRPFSSQPSPLPWLTKPDKQRSPSPSPWLTKPDRQRSPLNDTLAQYASVWDQHGKLSSKFSQLIQSESIKIEHHQKEVNNYQSVKKHSSTYETAQVESILTTKIESIHNLSTSEKVDALIIQLKQIHLEFDESVKRRIGQITSETESILAQIVEETQQSQQELLIQAKQQQTIQDEQYRILLEEFIAKLDEKRAKQLASIQEELQQARLNIFNVSQLKIRAVSEQANSVKNQIMSEEDKKASEKIDLIVTEINSISTESAIQNLGAEIKSDFNLTIHETVGSNNPQQQFQYDHEHQKQIKRTTFISNEITNNRRSSSAKLSDQQIKPIHQLAKQNPANPKTQKPK